jgi:hypothetical protein
MWYNIAADLHVFRSYVTGQLPGAHPLVVDTTHNDRMLEGIWLGNKLHTPNFLMWSFKHKKVCTMSDPRHFDTILPFLQPGDVGHKIDLTVDDISNMHVSSASSISTPNTVIQTRSRGSSSLGSSSSSTLTPSSDSGENAPLPDQGEQGIIQISESSDKTDRITDMVDNLLCENDLTLKQHKAFKQTEDSTPEEVIQY